MMRHITTSLSVVALSFSLTACSDTSSVSPGAPDYSALAATNGVTSVDLAKPDFYPSPVSTKIREGIEIDLANQPEGDGPVTWTAVDEVGNIVEREYDFDGDGKIDLRREYTFDSETGQMVSETLDKDADGVDDVRWFYEHDSAGNVVSKATDQNADGKIDSIWTKR